jgi:hypothetical protein
LSTSAAIAALARVVVLEFVLEAQPRQQSRRARLTLRFQKGGDGMPSVLEGFRAKCPSLGWAFKRTASTLCAIAHEQEMFQLGSSPVGSAPRKEANDLILDKFGTKKTMDPGARKDSTVAKNLSEFRARSPELHVDTCSILTPRVI